MLKIALLLLSLSSVANCAEEFKLAAKQGKRCVGVAGGRTAEFKLGKENQKLSVCKAKCENDPECTAMQYISPKQCSLWYDIVSMEASDDDTFCGRAKRTIVEDVVITAAPTSSPTYAKEYTIYKDSKCQADHVSDQKISKFADSSRSKCQLKCSTSKNCKAFQWNGKNKNCTIYKSRVTEVTDVTHVEGTSKICAIVVKITDAPTAAPVKSPTAAPVKSPTASPVATPTSSTKAPSAAPVKSPTTAPVKSPTAAPVAATIDLAVVCNLRAVLKFTFDTADAAAYYGYHSDYMEITKVGDDDSLCSNYYQDQLPAWCTYENSSPDGDSAFVSNVDDAYDELDFITTETIEISGFAGESYDISVFHYFFKNDYYANSLGWDDHMLAAVLKVKNMSTDQKQLSADGWSHPVDLWTPTHIKDAGGQDMENPDYQGKFKVTVDCDDACDCAATYVLL